MPETHVAPHDERLRRLYAHCARTDTPHLGDDALGAALAGSLTGPEREAALQHLERCAECAALAQHVVRCRECAAEFGAELARTGWRARLRPWPAFGSLAAAAAVMIALWWTGTRPGPSVAPGPPTTAAPLAGLRDGAGVVRLEADGGVSGVAAADEGLRRDVARALQSGVLPLPPELRQLAGTRMVLLGGPADQPRLEGIAPVGTLVRSDRPTLRWRAARDARGYLAAVFREDLTKAAGSPTLQGTEWTPLRPLARGATYLWQVAALTPQGRQVWPAPPEPEARFRIMDADSAAALDRALAGVGGSQLVAGLLLARAGVLDEAEQAFAELARANPGSPEAARLLEAVRQARHRPQPAS